MPQAPHPTIAAGDLDKRVTLLQPVYSAYEDEITEWASVSDVWAAIDPVAGREVEVSGKTTAVAEVMVTIRYRTDIDKRWRIQYGSRLFKVSAIRTVDTRNVRMILDCSEVE